ncbi:MurR/RpiR family transcriptional regulator [Lentibacillus cibarius]|uniref:MurR/RpiR family transcriptional regulator n=1 Tax=Lentibacillus cibarius TaxID=2583219 RepID=A0A549YJL7_9BACI|nr:MurR/RpiR family transcriptional regulator [Lentibacillus cibarius]RYG72450.1 MurR/RpiR family transcriptional regulator [Lentibacillus lipolyticus]TMN23257.1 MurR/RpiR family transcriptional regulator [Lentibacillus cibarius]TRM12044.1 MurR/RpiR family transcriptional regulator [Lentibacillus cibarius]
MEPSFIEETNKHFSTLTKGLRKVGDYLLSDPMIFAIHPAKKVGQIIGVSETTVLRFCNTIGYTSYNILQKDVRKYLLDLNQRPIDGLEENIETNNLAESMKVDINNLKGTIEHLYLEEIENAIETIIDSERITVAGYYQSFTFAHWLYFNLNYVLGNVSLYRPENDAGILDILPKKSCVIIFSYYRYALDTIRLAEEAKNKNIKVIAITDSRVSPIVKYADTVLTINISNKSLINKGPITLSLINALLNEVIQRVKERGKIRFTYKYLIKDGED